MYVIRDVVSVPQFHRWGGSVGTPVHADPRRHRWLATWVAGRRFVYAYTSSAHYGQHSGVHRFPRPLQQPVGTSMSTSLVLFQFASIGYCSSVTLVSSAMSFTICSGTMNQ